MNSVMFLRAFPSLDGDKYGNHGHESLSYSGETTLTFAGIRYSLAVFSVHNFTKIVIGHVSRDGLSARRVDLSVDEVDCVQSLMLRSKTSFNVLFSAPIGSTLSIYL